MNPCEECGLPILICNALASYRRAVSNIDCGNVAEAANYLKSANEDYDEYLSQYKAAHP